MPETRSRATGYLLVKQHVSQPDTVYRIRLLPDRAGAVWSVESGQLQGRSQQMTRQQAAEELRIWRLRCRREGGYLLGIERNTEPTSEPTTTPVQPTQQTDAWAIGQAALAIAAAAATLRTALATLEAADRLPGTRRYLSGVADDLDETMARVRRYARREPMP